MAQPFTKMVEWGLPREPLCILRIAFSRIRGLGFMCIMKQTRLTLLGRTIFPLAWSVQIIAWTVTLASILFRQSRAFTASAQTSQLKAVRPFVG